MTGIDRRTLLKTAAAATAASGGLVSVGASAQGKPVVNMQLGWLLSGNQIGEVCAKQIGYYEQEGIEMRSSRADRISTALLSSRPGVSRSGRCRQAPH